MNSDEATLLLDEALRIGAKELDALKVEDVDQATILCEKRSKLIEAGWAKRREDGEELCSRLLALRSLQESLIEEGRNLKQKIQDRLNSSKKQKCRMHGYGLSVKQALR